MVLTLSGPAFSVVRQAREGGGRLRGPDAKNQSFFQPIEMKRRMNHYKHKSISEAKFEAGSSSSFTTPQNFPRLFIPGKQV